MKNCDVLIKNGRVFDPASGFDLVTDVVVNNGMIESIGSYAGDSAKEIDAAGCLVIPGLIDLHMHLFPYSDVGVVPDLYCIPNGVTAAGDGGSTGWGNYENFRFYSALRKVTVKNFVNCSGAGLSVHGFPDQMNLNLMDGKGKDALRRLFGEYRNELAGIKLLIRPKSMKDYGEEPLLAALELAEELKTILMIHISDTTIPVGRIANLVRPGDILTHCFNDKGMTILDDNGQILPEVWDARQRGVIFDVGNARAHFGFATAQKALAQGFLPNTISTDTTAFGAYKRPVMFSLPMVMSKFLAMGMRVEDVIACSTSHAADVVDFGPHAGKLQVGSQADICIMKILDKEVCFEDHRGTKLMGSQLMKPVATLKKGELLWRDIEY